MSHKRSRSGTETRFAALSIGMPENISAAKSTSDRWETRTTDLHIEEVQGSLVIYDGRDDSVHYLTDDTLSVYAACPGSIDEIAELTGLPQDHVAAHLNELESRALVASHVVGTASRRSMVVGSALAVLGIWSMTAPTPAAASSTTGGGGGGGGGTPAPNMYYESPRERAAWSLASPMNRGQGWGRWPGVCSPGPFWLRT
jgi:hypothetical protein